MRTHRRGLPKSAFDAIPDRLLAAARRTAALLRIAVVLHRSHEADVIPELTLHAEGDALGIVLDKRWLDARPLLRTDLSSEPEELADLGVAMGFDTV